MKFKDYVRIVIYALLTIIIVGNCVVTCVSKHENKKLKETNELYATIARDSIKKYRNRLDEEVTRSEVLQASNSKLFLEVNSKDNMVKALQKYVKDKEKEVSDLRTALVFSNETNISLRDSLQNKIVGYSKKDSIIYPIYYKKLSEPKNWYSGNITLGRDTSAFDIKIKNIYDISIGSERVGWFKEKPFAEIINLNPYSETTNLKVYEKKPKTSNKLKVFGYGILTGIVGVTLGIIFLK